LFTTNPTCLDPVSNVGRRGGKAATNRLNYGTAIRLRLLGNRVLRRIFGPKSEEVKEDGENCIIQ
jgi:hypothetical protein